MYASKAATHVLLLTVLVGGPAACGTPDRPTGNAQAPSVAATTQPSSDPTPEASGAATSDTAAAVSQSPTRATSPRPVSLTSTIASTGPGWSLTRATTGLAAVGLTCADLPRYTGRSAPPAGTVISNVRVETALNLSAGNITVERSCIRPTSLSAGTALVTTTGACSGDSCAVTPATVTIRDSDIDGSALAASTVAKSCAFLGVGILERNYLHSMGTGICFFNTGSQLDAIAVGNYVHRLRAYGDPAGSGSHNEGATIRDFVMTANPNRRCVFRNNRIDSSSGNDTGALFIQTYGGDIDHVTIEGNLFEGGGYQLGLEAGFDNVYGRNMRAVNNRFSGTGWGPAYVTDKGLGYGWSQWSDNYINDPAMADNRGRRISAP